MAVLALVVGYTAAPVKEAPAATAGAVTTPDDYLQALSACLTAAGWKAEVSEQGDGISVDDLSGAQRDAFIQAKQLLEARQCLLDIGYAISEPPSIDTFIESWATGPWSPYLEVADMTTQQEWQDANEKCPQTPQ